MEQIPVKCMLNIWITKSSIDKYVFYYKKTVFLVYTDDSIIMAQMRMSWKTLLNY